MTWRVLPPAEWPRLAGTDLPWEKLPVDGLTVVVVEDAEGAIVAHGTLFVAAHAEQAWVRPDHRGRSRAFARLVEGLLTEAQTRWHVPAIVGGAADDRMRELLAKLGATRLPGEYYTVPTQQE